MIQNKYHHSIKYGFLLLVLSLSLACSAGKLLVQQPKPTVTPLKTVQATYTFTPDWTATFTPSPTATSTPTPTSTFTSTPTPTETPEEEEATAAPVSQEPAAPAPPTDTPTPEEPTPTPTPAYPFEVIYFTYPTGSPGQTRMTAWVRVDYGPGIFQTLSGFQVKAVAPDGNTYLSEITGPGHTDSTLAGTGDNHAMNTKLEFPPYLPGPYTLYLVEGGVQVSPEVQLELSADPLQYVHFDYFKKEKKP